MTASPSPQALTLKERSRDDLARELTLVLEAKKNINALAGTMYAVFYSLEGFLIYAFFTFANLESHLSIAFFGSTALGVLTMVTLRFERTNNRCDSRAVLLEQSLGYEVIINYVDPSPRPGASRPNMRMHESLVAADVVLIAFWIALAVVSTINAYGLY